MVIKVGDKVKVISGFNKGKEGVLLKKTKDGFVFVSGLKQKKRAKKIGDGNNDNFVFLDAPIHISNIKFLASGSNKNDKKAKVVNSK